MKKEIEIGGVQWFYEIYEDSDYDFYYIETRFYRTKTKIVNKRKYWIFGEKFQVEVEKGPRDFDFKLPFSIKNPKYTRPLNLSYSSFVIRMKILNTHTILCIITMVIKTILSLNISMI